MNEQEKIELLADTIDVEADDIIPSEDLELQEWWDSLTRLSLIVFLEEEFGKKVDTTQLNKMEKVSDILDLMES